MYNYAEDRRLGLLRVADDLIRLPGVKEEIMRNLTWIHRCEFLITTREYEYSAESRHFPKLKQGATLPTFHVRARLDAVGRAVIEFEEEEEE